MKVLYASCLFMNVEIGMAIKRNARYIFSSKGFPTADYRTTIAVDVCPCVHATIETLAWRTQELTFGVYKHNQTIFSNTL